MKFDALSAYLLQQKLCDKQKFDCWMESAQLIPVWKRSDNGLLICNVQYTAIYSLEKIHNANAQWLMVFVLHWLNENDDNRQEFNLANPSLQIDVINADLAEVEISIEFVEPINLVLDPHGKIEWQGQRWGFGEHTLWVAEMFGLIHGTPNP